MSLTRSVIETAFRARTHRAFRCALSGERIDDPAAIACLVVLSGRSYSDGGYQSTALVSAAGLALLPGGLDLADSRSRDFPGRFLLSISGFPERRCPVPASPHDGAGRTRDMMGRQFTGQRCCVTDQPIPDVGSLAAVLAVVQYVYPDAGAVVRQAALSVAGAAQLAATGDLDAVEARVFAGPDAMDVSPEYSLPLGGIRRVSASCPHAVVDCHA